MEGVAKTVCPQCNGKGRYYEQDGINAVPVVCTGCKGSGVVDVLPNSMFQGCRHSVYTGPGSPVNGYPRTGTMTDPYWMPQPSKTLLDEFAMAAMTGVIACPVDSGFVWRDDPTFDGFIASSSFDIAAAMMKERARRDEMGNVKEVEK